MKKNPDEVNVTMFKSLAVGLKELEPFIRQIAGRHIQVGKPLKKFGRLLPRELLGNWLVCVVDNFITGKDRLTFTSPTDGGDGMIVDTISGGVIGTEHVMEPGPHPGAPQGRSEEVGDLIIEKISKKQKRGAEYGSGKWLVVLSNEIGVWHPNKVAKALPAPLHFAAVWVAALQGVIDGEYTYCVARLDLRREGNVPAWRVRIAGDFSSWHVEDIQ